MNILRRRVTRVSGSDGKNLWCAGVVGSVQVVTAIVLALTLVSSVQAAVFTCPSGDSACLIDAINTANENGEENTIQLEAGVYSLTAIDNMTDEANGLPSITSSLTIVGAELLGLPTGEEEILPPLPVGMTTVIERNALTSPPPFRLFHVAEAGTLVIERLTLRGGDASVGGGLFNLGTLTIRDSTVVGNRAIVAGGLSNSGTLTLITSTLTANSGEDVGGGISNSGTVTITNSTVADNTGALGGGLFNFGTITVTNSTISRNVASFRAGGLLNNGTVSIQNTILARNISNDSPDCFGSLGSLGNNLVGMEMGCTTTVLPGAGDLDRTGNPLLAELSDIGTPGFGHFPPRPDSPAIDAGNDAVCPDTDQLGRGRLMVLANAPHICDIGAIEFHPDIDL